MRRLIVVLVLLAGVVVAVAHPPARAEYQGSSLAENVAPPTDGRAGLADRYPLNRYGLDQHVNAGVTDLDGVPALVGQFFAGLIWDFTRFLVSGVITLFMFAFSLDLVAGDRNGAHGALAPIAQATRAIYDALGQDWLPTAIALAGGLAAWQVFIRRELVRTASQAAVSVACVLLAIFIVTQPQFTIGGVSRVSHELALAMLGLTHDGLERGETSKQQATDQLFRTLIYDPWVVLNFGGLEHCVDEHDRPVRVTSSTCRTRIDHRKKYAERWLKAGAPGAEARDQEYEAIRDGKLPDVRERPRDDDGYRVSAADRPAVDIQQQAMAGERLGYVLMTFLGELGAVLLLGALAIGVIFGQVLALLLFAFAPVVLIAALFPGAGHAAFRTWLERLLLALLRPAIYGLVLGIVLAISSALLAASTTLGWMLAFGFQCIFYWAVFLYRREVHNAVVRAVPGSAGSQHHDVRARARDTYYTAKMLTPAAAAAGSIAGSATGAVVGRSSRLMRDGVTTAGQLVDGYATRGHTTRMASSAATTAAAIEELEADHRADRDRIRAEQTRRTQIGGLERRANADGHAALSEADQQLLTALREQSIDDESYGSLRERVAEIEQRRHAGEPLFTDEQIRERAERIAAREEAEGSDVGSTDGVHDPELERRLQETRRLADRASAFSAGGESESGSNAAAARRRPRWLRPVLGRRSKDNR